MKKLFLILVFVTLLVLVGNSFAQTEYVSSWSDHGTAILDSITAVKYILAGVDVDKDGKQEFIVPIDYGTLNGVKVSQIAVFEAVGDDDYELVWSYTYPGESDWQLTKPTVGDLDGDGNLEILAIRVQPTTGDPTIPNLYVFECVGDNDYGTEPAVTWDLNDNVRNNIRCVAAADLDKDGTMEVVLTARDNPPGVVIASVSSFTIPTWTIEYIDSTTYTDPDMAGVAICDMDGDGYKEVALTPLQADSQIDLYLIEYDGTTYQKILPPPKHVWGKGVIHALDAADLDGDGRDELYIGAVSHSLLYVVTKPTGNVIDIDTTDIYFIGKVEHPDYQTGTGWMPGATLGDADGDGKMSFLGSASGTVGCGVNDWEYQGGGVTDIANWQYSYIDLSTALGWGNDFFIYGIDFSDDMDGDDLCEIIVARGNPNLGHTIPAIYVTELAPSIPEETQYVGSWSDHGTAILDSITAVKYILAGVDVDKDGKQEFIVPIDYGTLNGVKVSQIAVFEAVGDDDYELVWSYTYPGESDWQLTKPTVGDLDGDGNLEILAIRVQPTTGDPTIPNLYVFECVGDNDYGTEPAVTWDLNDNVRNNIRCVAAADLDKDGTMEVVLTARDNPPGVVIASVSSFTIPTWTIEYIDSTTYTDPDMAGVAICDMDGDGYKEVALTPLQADSQIDLYLIEYDGTTYQKILPPPKHVWGKGVIHALDAADLDGDGRDELYIGAVSHSLLYVVTKPTGNVIDIDTTDIYFIGKVEHPDYQTGTGWMPGATLGDADGDGKMSFLGSASGTVGCGVNDWEYQGGGVTDIANWQYSYIDLSTALGWGNDFFIYGIDFSDDMDGDDLCEIIVARGNPNLGHTIPAIYVTELAPRVGVSPEGFSTGIPEIFSLKQNYPNPFNPTTRISYELPISCKITLDIYNILGQKVRTLVYNRFHQKGSYEVSWNALDDSGNIVASGVYIYTIKADDFNSSKKMLLIR